LPELLRVRNFSAAAARIEELTDAGFVVETAEAEVLPCDYPDASHTFEELGKMLDGGTSVEAIARSYDEHGDLVFPEGATFDLDRQEYTLVGNGDLANGEPTEELVESTEDDKESNIMQIQDEQQQEVELKAARKGRASTKPARVVKEKVAKPAKVAKEKVVEPVEVEQTPVEVDPAIEIERKAAAEALRLAIDAYTAAKARFATAKKASNGVKGIKRVGQPRAAGVASSPPAEGTPAGILFDMLTRDEGCTQAQLKAVKACDKLNSVAYHGKKLAERLNRELIVSGEGKERIFRLGE
jgi:hypothetical protein